MYGSTHQVHTPIRRPDGQDILTDSTSFFARWSEHLQSLFSANRYVEDTAIHHIPQLLQKQVLDQPPTLEGTIRSILYLLSHKVGRLDGISPEIWMHVGPTFPVKLRDLLVCCWKQFKFSYYFCDLDIITMGKNKGEKSDCSNSSGIILPSIVWIVISRDVLNRLLPTIAEKTFLKSFVASEPTEA